ncbi:MAG: PTS lactose/cellobiose transporter subunit IIA [Liquorilactobacillus nagelii]|uniref:PTS cellobiose transporter subunit IIA n=2 Tax=Liquorilactobacillus nagelii TaxID=82688 RepID=A0A3S6QZ66_9LACO|nr:PTS lactose/cellobiose transporter subunit IIA [Liquorilactobacillus nagelii]AUJ31497.1 PTS cellobiose transporter subunit IIA [Liquorilactobacillus nagelii]MCC7617345.1 PTS lactose/cellobiose transporter subunit IIA [Liquorilactobacillus nagelii]MCP9316226.1 PTS lactose/cellobiose transporter subunit IIA [Liquorilactobacillus nagelii]QYH54570.1 PTS lactose/cellobiose transporter subunit IIA [Liquorilactobacillus nagelii DSM 13675]
MNDDVMKVIMGLIMEGGNAKSFAIKAINAAKENDFVEADKQIKKSEKALGNAHNIQTNMLTKEAQGEHTEVNLYMVHAQDWLMTGITFKDLAKEIVELYENLNQKNK